jgi:N-acetylglucosaminyl-diphospho-decaprenol L-rhamnosyltransferase
MTVDGGPRVLAAIVNYNRADLTLVTVDSLLGLSGEAPMMVLVIDNASATADLDRLRTELPAQVSLMELAVNGGYGTACNAAIRQASAEDVPFVWLLNNDIAFEPGCLRELVRVLDDCPDLAASAPVVVEFNRPDIVLSSGMKVGMRFGRVSHRRWGLSVASLPSHVERVDAVEASALLIRTSAAAACGGFDESFFMYSEDLEWSLRARNHGWALASAPTARVRHRLSQSSAPLNRIEYMIRNRIRAVRLHGSVTDQATFMAYMVFGWLPAYALTRLLFRYGPGPTAKAVLRPLIWNIRDAARRGHWRLTSADQLLGPRTGEANQI